ncbi:MAG: hypothetical protein RLY93_20955 [Sumerlaeia bacterium]
MKVIKKGRDEVLGELEEQTRRITNSKPGEYLLLQDDEGQVLLVAAGRIYTPFTGKSRWQGNRLQVQAGSVVEVAPAE